jgi:hypothetical protein
VKLSVRSRTEPLSCSYAALRPLSYSIHGCKSVQYHRTEHAILFELARGSGAWPSVSVAIFRRIPMKLHCSRLVFILTALTPLLMAYPALAVPLTAQPAAWVPFDLSVGLHNLPRRYSCDELRSKFRDVLLVLGARTDLKVLIARCELGSRSPFVRVQFVMPELLERTSKRGGVMDAAAGIVRLEPGHPPSLSAADCELMRQVKDGLLAPLSRRVVSFNLACSAVSSSGPRFNLSVQTLKPLGGARVADEVKLPIKQPN